MRYQCLGCGKKFFFQQSMFRHYDMCNLAKILNEGLKKFLKVMNDLMPSVAQAADACNELGIAMKKYVEIDDDQQDKSPNE